MFGLSHSIVAARGGRMSHTTADEQVDTGATVDHVDLAIRGLGEGSAGSWGSRIRRGLGEGAARRGRA